MDINQTTEEMIQMFLKYGTKQSLSVDEFLLLRKQVVDEMLSGVKVENKLQYTINTPPQVFVQQQTTSTFKPQNEEIKSEYNENREKKKNVKEEQTSSLEKVKLKEDVSSITTQSNQIKFEKPIEKKEREDIIDDAEENEDFEEEKFSDKDFLAMMRQVED